MGLMENHAWKLRSRQSQYPGPGLEGLSAGGKAAGNVDLSHVTLVWGVDEKPRIRFQ